MNIIPIVFSTDHKFVMPTGVAISSLIRNSSIEQYEINILISEDVTSYDKEQLLKTVENSNSSINFKLIEGIFDNAYEIRGISKATYFRLLIPWIFPQYDKVVYCDGDIIFRKGIYNLYTENINYEYVAGVKDFYATTDYKKYIYSIGLKWETYINAGILLINCKLQRKEEIDKKLLPYFNKQYKYQDQDIINIVFKDRIKYISPIYNFNSKAYSYLFSNNTFIKNRYNEDAMTICKNLHIIHYCGKKPWNSMTEYLTADWFANYATSVWYNPIIENNEYKNLIYPKFTLRKFFKEIKNRLTL